MHLRSLELSEAPRSPLRQDKGKWMDALAWTRLNELTVFFPIIHMSHKSYKMQIPGFFFGSWPGVNYTLTVETFKAVQSRSIGTNYHMYVSCDFYHEMSNGWDWWIVIWWIDASALSNLSSVGSKRRPHCFRTLSTFVWVFRIWPIKTPLIVSISVVAP